MLSVIIPTWNEAGSIASTIAAVREQGPAEIIVVDGGSTDATLAEAVRADHVISGPRGRAAQMNYGASLAQGDRFLFLHADCRPEPGAFTEAQRLLRRPGVVAVCFQMRVEATGLGYRLIDAAGTIRVRLTGIAYGDQGLLLSRSVFTRIGGFPALRFMEDVFISRRLRRLGRIAVTSRPLAVSPRRWQRVGLVRQSLRNWTLTALAMAGVHPDHLAHHYPAIR